MKITCTLNENARLSGFGTPFLQSDACFAAIDPQKYRNAAEAMFETLAYLE